MAVGKKIIPGEVVAGLQEWVAVSRVFPFATAEVQGLASIVTDALFDLECGLFTTLSELLNVIVMNKSFFNFRKHL